jgi:oligosaccharide repeat unit polymerase
MKFIFFIIAFIIALISILQFTFSDIDLFLSFVYLISQTVFGLIVLNSINGAFYPQDIRVLFLIIMFLYSFFYPLVVLMGFDPFSITTLPETTFYFALGFTGFNIGNMLLKVKFTSIDVSVVDVKFSRLLLILLLEITFATAYLKAKDIPIFSEYGSFNRSFFFESIDQVWIVLAMLISITSCFVIYYSNNTNKFLRYVGFALIIYYILLQLSLGNRRDFVPIILFATVFYLVKYKSKLNLKFILISLFFFFGSFWVAQVRTGEDYRNDEDLIKSAFVANEFVFPMQTLAYTIQDDWGYRFGSTYFILPIQILIPRMLYPNKPSDLGTEFVNKTFGEGYQGYAYTPVTEAYLNFGFIGPPLVFLFISIFFSALIWFFNKGVILIWYYFFYSFIFDFCRGTFSTVFYLVLVSFVFYFMLNKLISRTS